MNHYNITDPNRIGDIHEYKAVCWLLEQGYEVFKNVGCTGKIDLISKKDNKITQIQVKTVRLSNHSGNIDLCFRYKGIEEDLKNNIRPLWVYFNQVGWNRDYFSEEVAFNDWKTYNHQHIKDELNL